MGRHLADSTDGRDADGGDRARSAGDRARSAGDRARSTGTVPEAAHHDLLFWGIFLAATAAAAMAWVGIDWPVTAACALLLLVSFAAVWRVQRVTGRSAAAGARPAAASAGGSAPDAGKPAADPEPAPETAPAQAPVVVQDPVVVQASVRAEEPAPAPQTRKQMRAADPTTGLLPVIRASTGSVPPAPAKALTGLETVVPGGRRERRRAAASAAPDPQEKPAAQEPPAPSAPAPQETPALQETPVLQETPAPFIGESRWTRTFGPPETGQLPVQRYAAGTAAVDPADPDLPDRRQRSHSSL